MTWKIRHEGSPKSIDDLTLDEVIEGLQEGQWETTDEVMGPNDTQWVALENHPQLEEIAADIEPPPPPPHDDETRLDMNPLIDVCLVLLIFFILTTSYAALQKVLDSPSISEDNDTKMKVVSRADVEKVMIMVRVTMEDGKPVIHIDKDVVPKERLLGALKSYVGKTPKTELLLEPDPEVPHGTLVAIQDAAKKAGVLKIHFAREVGG
jgi:biopolymer transport protein ExbD